jgi:hypothetical protein
LVCRQVLSLSQAVLLAKTLNGAEDFLADEQLLFLSEVITAAALILVQLGDMIAVLFLGDGL